MFSEMCYLSIKCYRHLPHCRYEVDDFIVSPPSNEDGSFFHLRYGQRAKRRTSTYDRINQELGMTVEVCACLHPYFAPLLIVIFILFYFFFLGGLVLRFFFFSWCFYYGLVFVYSKQNLS